MALKKCLRCESEKIKLVKNSFEFNKEVSDGYICECGAVNAIDGNSYYIGYKVDAFGTCGAPVKYQEIEWTGSSKIGDIRQKAQPQPQLQPQRQLAPQKEVAVMD